MLVGTVDRITDKMVNTKFGPKKAYSMQIDGTWYSAGFNIPPCTVGDEVSFEAKTTSYGEEIVKGTMRKTGAIPTTAAPVPGSVSKHTAPAPGGKVFPIPVLHGDRAIVRQNALAHATKVVVDNMSYEEGKIIDYDAIAEKVIYVARRFEAYACGDLDREMAEKMTAKKAVKKAIEADTGETE